MASGVLKKQESAPDFGDNGFRIAITGATVRIIDIARESPVVDHHALTRAAADAMAADGGATCFLLTIRAANLGTKAL